jgi:esterase/lipase superfamily enzyme
MLKVVARPMTTGASLGAYLAANEYSSIPDSVSRNDTDERQLRHFESFLDGYYDDNVLLQQSGRLPLEFEGRSLPADSAEEADAFYIMTGQGDYDESRSQANSSQAFSSQKEFPHTLDLWGPDVNHDWPLVAKDCCRHVLGMMFG